MVPQKPLKKFVPNEFRWNFDVLCSAKPKNARPYILVNSIYETRGIAVIGNCHIGILD